MGTSSLQSLQTVGLQLALSPDGAENGHSVYPNVAKVGGLQNQGAKGAAVVDLLQALGNAGSGVLRLSPMSIKQG